jgi:hypothetical protein
MAYRIEGLAPQPFESLFSMNDGELAERGARRVVAPSSRGYPCRVSLEDAVEGEELVLLQLRQCIDWLAVDQDVDLHHVRLAIVQHGVIERSVPLRDRLQPIVEIEQHLGQR